MNVLRLIRSKRRRCYSGLQSFGFTFLFLVVSSAPVVLVSQSSSKINDGTSLSTQSKQTKAFPVTEITLSVRDSTIEYVINAISKSAKLKPIYNTTDPLFKKRTTVSVSKLGVKEALETVLKGTGLVARLASDGQTLMIRPETVDKNGEDRSTQQGTGNIVGRVIDSTSTPIEGAVVHLSVGSRSAIADSRGTFVIKGVPAGDYSLSIRAIGYVSTSSNVKVGQGDDALVSIVLRRSATSLGEVVTTATGSQRKVELGVDIVKIDAAEIRQRAPVRSIGDMLSAAQVPGLLVQRASGDPGSPLKLRFRGIGSISQSNDPVIMLDGVWIDAASGKGTGSRLEDIDPDMIESIEIVRGPSAATLYGQDAANGVIVIKTKRGQAGPARWSLNASRDWGQVYGKKPLSYIGVGRTFTTQEETNCTIDRILRNECSQDSVIILDPNHPLLAREGGETTNRISLGVSGGSAAMSYSVMFNASGQLGARRIAPLHLIRYRRLGFQTDRDFLEPTHQSRRGINSSYSLSPSPKTSVTVSLNGALTGTRNNRYINDFPNSVIAGKHDSLVIDTMAIESRRSTITPQRHNSEQSSLLLSSNAIYRLNDNWNIAGDVGLEQNSSANSHRSYLVSCTFVSPCTDSLGERKETTGGMRGLTLRSNLTGSLPPIFKGLLEIRPAFGFDFRKTNRIDSEISNSDIPPNTVIAIGSGPRTFNSYSRYGFATAGWYVNSTFKLFNRIYFDMGIRQDIGSAAVPTSRYPKLANSWVVSDEPFWKENRFIQMFRLRGAVGYAAVQPGAEDVHGAYRASTANFEGRFVPIALLNGVGNAALLPERAKEIEGGFDAVVLNDKIEIIATYAYKNNTNVLVARTIAPSISYGSLQRKENLGAVKNLSGELAVNATAVDRPNLRALFNYALTMTSNEVTYLGPRMTPFSEGTVGRIEVGYPLAGVWHAMLLGYKDVDENELISNDEVIVSDSLVYIGWSQPKYRASYGVNILLNKIISFDTRFAYQSQYVQQYASGTGRGAQDQNASLGEQALERILFRSGDQAPLSGKRSVSDLRWSSASVTIHLPSRIARQLRANSTSVSLQASNLYLWSNYMGRDPSIGGLAGSEIRYDNGDITPTPRRFVLDIRMVF